MEKIEVSIISEDTIRPLATSSSLLPPYKLSILDQLTPALYFPLVFFYPITDPDFNLAQTLTNLKDAFSQTVTMYYPISGKVKKNLYIDNFETGVPYLEARVNCHIKDFMRFRKIKWLDQLVPITRCHKDSLSDELYPLLGVQVNIFDSGIAIGFTMCHKLLDATTMNYVLNTWGAIFRGRRDKIIFPNLEAALLFPPKDDFPKKYVVSMDRLWFPKTNTVTKRFVFTAKAISALQDEGKSECVPKPSRIQALVAFLWKSQLAASRALSTGVSPTVSIAMQVVDIRSKMNAKPSLDGAIGNLIWQALAVLNLNTERGSSDHKMCDLVKSLIKSVEEVNGDYFENLKGEKGHSLIYDWLNSAEQGTSIESAPEFYVFSSGTKYFGQDNFGWGVPLWTGFSAAETNSTNVTLLTETANNEIEAWMTLDEKKMTMLEQDPQFVALTSSNFRTSRY